MSEKTNEHGFKQEDIVFILKESCDNIFCVRKVTGVNPDKISTDQNEIYSLGRVLKATYYNLKNATNDSNSKKKIAYRLLNYKKYKDVHDVSCKIKEIASSIFNENNIEIKSESLFNDYIEVIIKFPKIVIKNSAGLFHTIKNMYIKFVLKFSNREISLNSMEGLKTHFSKVEIKNSYLHSHINWSEGEIVRYSSFCMGYGEYTDIYNSLQYYTIDYIKFFDQFEFLLLGLENFLSWESLEGAPYRHMRSLSKYKAINDNMGAPFKQDIFNSLKKKFSFKLTTEDIELEPFIYNDDFFLKISRETMDRFVSGKAPLDVFKVDGVLFMFQNNEEIINVNKPEIDHYEFKGRRLRTKIIVTNKSEMEFTDDQKTHSPRYVDKLYRDINNIFIEFQVRNEEYGNN